MEDRKEVNVSSNVSKSTFETNNKIKTLGFMLVIVDKFLEDSIRSIMKKNGCSAVFIKHGYGSATKAFYESNHLVEKQKALLYTLVTEDLYEIVKQAVVKKLNTSKFTKGVVIYKKLSSIVGVSNYKFFSHHDYIKEVKSRG